MESDGNGLIGASNGRVRVVHLVLSLDFGGLEMVAVDLARATDRARFEPHVVCLRSKGALAPRLEERGIAVHSLDCPTLPKVRTLARLVRILRQLRPQVLHTHNPSPHLFGVMARHLAGVPVLVHTKHGRNYPHKWRAVLVNRIAARLTDCIAPVSEASSDIARTVEHVADNKLQVIRNGIDLAEFPEPSARAAPPGRRAIQVARLIKLKDQFTLLRATRLVVDKMPDFGLDIIGDGPEREALLALRTELKLEDHVRFLGFRSDVRQLLPNAEFFILSSLSEGLAISILEAMAAGLPVVATDVGGNREVVGDGESGILVPSQQPEAMAAAMMKMHGDPERTRRMGLAARERVDREFNLRRVAERYEDLYVALLQARQGAASDAGVREAEPPVGAQATR